ncbi:MAG: hypothetical protein WCW87_04285 [Candidatus Paceibacterota bacterium]
MDEIVNNNIVSSFNISENELEKIKLWLNEHNKNCPFAKRKLRKANDGKLSYVFTPSVFGTKITVNCKCESSDSRFDVTDYHLGW